MTAQHISEASITDSEGLEDRSLRDAVDELHQSLGQKATATTVGSRMEAFIPGELFKKCNLYLDDILPLKLISIVIKIKLIL